MTQQAQSLQYESTFTTRRRVPRWVWSIVAVYGVLLVALCLVPAWAIVFDGDQSFAAALACTVGVMLACGFALLLTPVNLVRQRPVSQRSFLIPLIASGLLMGVLVCGAVWALWEAMKGDDLWSYAAMAGGGIVWFGWCLVIWLATRTCVPASIALRLHRWLLMGSVAELLVAVPCHVIVRRRNECCAGYVTGTAICLGAMVMIVCFGPSVLMLYLKRSRDISV